MRRAFPESLLVMILGCSTPTLPSSPPPLGRVVTTSAPVDWLVRTLLPADSLPVEALLPPGADAATWQPTADQLVAVQQGALLLTHGAGLEPWVATSSVPLGNRVDTTRTVTLVAGPPTRHRHGTDSPHEHTGPDPHSWLDPQRYALQGAAVAEALVRLLPDRADEVRTAQADLQAELHLLDSELMAALACVKERALAANHPTWTYWADRAGLSLPVFPFEPGNPPSAEDLALAKAWSAEASAPLLLWEASPGPAVPAALPGVQHLVLDPLESAAEGASYDYVLQAQANIAHLSGLCDLNGNTPAP